MTKSKLPPGPPYALVENNNDPDPVFLTDPEIIAALAVCDVDRIYFPGPVHPKVRAMGLRYLNAHPDFDPNRHIVHLKYDQDIFEKPS